MNSIWVASLSSTRMAVKSITSPKLPLNEGFNRPIRLIAPEGCIYNARSSAPCYLCGNVSQTIPQLIYKALAEVLPERIPACSGGDVIGQGLHGVDPQTGRYWGTLTPCVIGQGAGFESDGDAYVMASPQNIPAEIMESAFPMCSRGCTW
jgi:N-methylhydantoinase B